MKKSVLICGVDEAGRGPLAGPVYAAAVILGYGVTIEGLADSKKMTARKRDQLFDIIKERAADWAIASASVEEIDTINILQASLLAMRRAVEQLRLAPHQVLVDGLHCPKVSFPVRAIVKGDATVAEISAASILAKVERDKVMAALHVQYPQYRFDLHKGYPTGVHLAALQQHGVSAVHRRSYAPVKKLIN